MMLLHAPLLRATAAVAVAGLLLVAFAARVHAQDPPSTIFGSIADSEGPIEEGLPVVAYVGDTVCSYTGDDPRFKEEVIHVGEGESPVAMYTVNVFAASQRPGCGTEGAEVRIQIGDRVAPQTAIWRAGLVRLDITFGDATPAPIPTVTPTPTPTITPTPVTEDTPTPAGTPSPTVQETPPPGSTPLPTLAGGVTTGTGAPRTSDDGGGFPLWGVAALFIGAIVIVGGGIGFVMARQDTGASDDVPPEAPDEQSPAGTTEDR